MGLMMTLIGMEVVLAVASAIHAMLKRGEWVKMWALWHVLPLWWIWLGLWAATIALAEGAAGRAADRHHHRQSMDPVTNPSHGVDEACTSPAWTYAAVARVTSRLPGVTWPLSVWTGGREKKKEVES